MLKCWLEVVAKSQQECEIQKPLHQSDKERELFNVENMECRHDTWQFRSNCTVWKRAKTLRVLHKVRLRLIKWAVLWWNKPWKGCIDAERVIYRGGKWKQQITVCPSCCLHLLSLIVQPGWIDAYLLYSDGQCLYWCGVETELQRSSAFQPTLECWRSHISPPIINALTGRGSWGKPCDVRTFGHKRTSVQLLN